MSQTHSFALYFNKLSDQNVRVGSLFVISDETMYHRMVHVLRMQIGDSCTIFDRQLHILVEVSVIEKKRIAVLIKTLNQNRSSSAKITFLLPMLKKESFEQALYSLVEVGVDEIRIVVTEKSQKKYTEHEVARAEKILIAAAEQSKNFRFPEISKPESLEGVLQAYTHIRYRKICAHPEGRSFFDFAQTQFGNDQEYVLTVGPEADFSSSEMDLLRENFFERVALTPTILRSYQAAFLIAGVVRSLVC